MSNLYIFDCFGVVVSEVSTIWMNKHLDDERQKRVRAAFWHVDRGEMSFDEAFELLASLANMPVEEARAEWNNDLWVFPETVNLIDDLRAAGHEVVLLSNAAAEFINEVFDRFGLFEHFDRIFVSADYGCAKPDKKFYQICLDACAKTHQKVFFTDDNPLNLAVAETLGITTVLFTDALSLRKELHL